MSFSEALMKELKSIWHDLYPTANSEFELLHQLLVQKKTERNPLWFEEDSQDNRVQFLQSNQHVAIMVYVDHFAHDIRDLIGKVSYFKELGITLVHLMPLLKSPKEASDGGYAVSDFTSVNPNLGTMDDLQQLILEFKRYHIEVVLDFVINHCSDQHEWAVMAKNGSKVHQSYFHLYSSDEFPKAFNAVFNDVFPESSPGSFTYNEELQAWVMTIFHHYQWDLNYGNPKVFLGMLSYLLDLANKGVRFFRLDAVAFLGKNPFDPDANQAFIHRILQLYKLCTQLVCPSVYLIAEAIDQPKNILPFFGNQDSSNNECDIAYNATLMYLLWDALAAKNTQLLSECLMKLPSKPSHSTWINYARCHDEIGFLYDSSIASSLGISVVDRANEILDFFTSEQCMGLPYMVQKNSGSARISGTLASLCGLEYALSQGSHTDIELAIRKINLLQAVVLSFGGIPLIYSGDEIGQLNDYSYTDNPNKNYDNRWLHRPLFTKGQHAWESSIYESIQQMIQIRKQNMVFSDQYPAVILRISDKVFAFQKNSEDQEFLALFSFSDQDESVIFHSSTSSSWFNLRSQELHFGNQLTMHPFEFYWLVRADDQG